MLHRVRTWDVDLVAWALARQGAPFAWGTTDCWSLVREAQAVLWGFDRWVHLPRPATLADVDAALATHGSMRDALLAMGMVPVPHTCVQAGDVLFDDTAHDGRGAAAVAIEVTRVLLVGEGDVVTIVPLVLLGEDFDAVGWR